MNKQVLRPTLFLVLLFVSSAICAEVPAGSPPKNCKDAYVSSDVVFEGKVIRVYKDAYGYDSTADVRIQQVWKGRKYLASLTRIDGTGGPTYPARIFKMGQVYLFYLPANLPGKELRADSYLQRVLPQQAAAGDLKCLSKLKSSTP